MVHHDISQQCLDVAYRYLSYRPRSEGEMKQRLQKRGFNTEIIERTIRSFLDAVGQKLQ